MKGRDQILSRALYGLGALAPPVQCRYYPVYQYSRAENCSCRAVFTLVLV